MLNRVTPSCPVDSPVTGHDLRVLKSRSDRREQLVALALVSAPLAFILVSVVIPISSMLLVSVKDPVLGRTMPRFAAAVRAWDGQGGPPPVVVKSFVSDLIEADADRLVGRVASRLNREIPGFRSLLLQTGARMAGLARAVGEDALLEDEKLLSRLVALDGRWQERRYWVRMRQAAPPLTLAYVLRTVDRALDLEDRVVMVPPDRRLFVNVFWRTLWICLNVTIICLCLGFPIAYLLARMPTSQSNVCLLFLLLPLWTSVLVKSLSWLVTLQNEGVVNDLAIIFGLWNEPLELARNRVGTYVSMVHVLLPFMTFPLFSVMKGIDEYHMKAAATMGANPWQSFVRVYLPQTWPGMGAGVLLVFILALGLYVPPALVGGPGDQMLSYFIAWGGAGGGLAAALSIILLSLVGFVLLAFHRLIGIDRTLFR